MWHADGAGRCPHRLIFGDIQGKLDVLRVDCTKMSKWVSELKADCPRRNAHALHERCDVLCPDLPKIL